MPHANPREMKRLQKELEEIQKQADDPDAQVSAHMIDDDLTRWKGYLKGPCGTPYEGGRFILDITLPPDYPYTAPKIKFETRIWHPNVSSQTGAICLDILKNEWSPALTIRTALLSIQALMSSPEPDDPQDAEVASMYKSNKAMFDQTAMMWTEMFAKNQEESHEAKVQKICEIGFSRDQALDALQRHDWNETVALNALLGS